MRKERKFEDKSTSNTARETKRQANRQEDKQTERSYVGLSILSDSKSGVDPSLVLAPGRP